MRVIYLYIILYLISSILFNEYYKICTKYIKNTGAFTILLEIIASLFCIFFIPFFKIKFPSNTYIYLFLFISTIFYSLSNRLSTISRTRVEVSVYSIIKQLSSIFMIFIGILFFKESINIYKIIGIILIIFSNILIFYKKNIFKIDKYIIYGILSNIFLTISLVIDLNYSDNFNLAIYIFFIMFIPSFLTFIFSKVKTKDIVLEYKNSNKISLFITSIFWVIMLLSKILSYQNKNIILVSTFLSLNVILNVLVSYIWFNEKDNLIKKLISSILIIIGIVLIKL